METQTQTLEELFIQASENESEKLLNTILERVSQRGKLEDPEVLKQIEFLLESWGDSIPDSPVKASFCISLAEIPVPDSPLFRNVLGESVKKMLPPYLSKSGFYRSLGLRDNNVPVKEIANRFLALQKLKNGVVAYQPDLHRWVKVTNIDEFTSTVAVTTYNGASSYAVPLSVVLSFFKVFNPSTEILKLIKPDRKNLLPSESYRTLIRELSYTRMYDELAREIAFYTIVPDILSANDFDKWWASKSTGSVAAPLKSENNRSPSEARSVQEMQILLDEFTKAGKLRFDENDVVKFTAFFTNFRPLKAMKDNLMLAESLCVIATVLKDAELARISEPLKKKCPFWPESFENIRLEALDVWGQISAKQLPDFIRITRLMFSDEYLARISMFLPLRCLNTLCTKVPHSDILTAIKSGIVKTPTCDMLLWIWKNRSKLPDALSCMVNIETVLSGITILELPKAWGPSQRELKRMLVEKEDFQKYLIAAAKNDATILLFAIQKAKNLNHAEQQSILVKLSRYSLELRDILEKGEVKKANANNNGPEKAVAPPQIPVTSPYSYAVRVKELDDIIKIHTPENRESLKTARAHGDFRENAEYDAAKERRNFLSKRRSELEQDIQSVHKIDFRTVKPDDVAVIGSTVKVQLANGKIETFFLLGAWDGDPDNNCISYKTRLGEILLGVKVGGAMTMLDGTESKLIEVLPLPEHIIKKYCDEK